MREGVYKESWLSSIAEGMKARRLVGVPCGRVRLFAGNTLATERSYQIAWRGEIILGLQGRRLAKCGELVTLRACTGEAPETAEAALAALEALSELPAVSPSGRQYPRPRARPRGFTEPAPAASPA